MWDFGKNRKNRLSLLAITIFAPPKLDRYSFGCVHHMQVNLWRKIGPGRERATRLRGAGGGVSGVERGVGGEGREEWGGKGEKN